MDLLLKILNNPIAMLTLKGFLMCGLIFVLFKLVKWGKKAPKGAFVSIACMPFISIFPIPPQEIKKLEQIKQEQIKEEDENGQPKGD